MAVIGGVGKTVTDQRAQRSQADTTADKEQVFAFKITKGKAVAVRA